MKPSKGLATPLGATAVTLGGLFAAGVFLRGLETAPGQLLCDNSFCLRLPSGWDGRTESGSIIGRLIAAPFTLPSWVGRHQQGTIAIPRGRYVISLSVSDRGYLFGWPRVTTIVVSTKGLRSEPAWARGDKSFVYRAVSLHDRSANVLVQFADANPTKSQFATVNRVLATLHRAAPPVQTQ